MQTSRPLAIVAACSVALLATGCAIDAGHDAERNFIEHFTSTYPDQVVDTTTFAAESLPFTGGQMAGAVIVADDTPPEDFATILDDVATWDAGRGVTYDPLGVVGNGVGVCLTDEHQEQKQALRDALYADGLALEGQWPCPQRLKATESIYQGTLAQGMQDAETVRRLWDGPGEFRLVGEFTEPWGTVDYPWPDLPPTLDDALHAVEAEHDIVGFELTEAGLRIAIAPTGGLEQAQESAQAAAGADLPVQLLQGSLDAAKADQFGGLADIADDLRTVPGAESVSVTQVGGVAVTTRDAGALAAIVDRALTHEDFAAEGQLVIRVIHPGPDGQNETSTYTRWPGGTGELLPVFEQLLDQDVVSWIAMTDPLPSPNPDDPPIPGLKIRLTGTVVDGLPQLRSALPDGLLVTVTGADHRDTVDFTTAPRLSASDLDSIFTVPDKEAIAKAWNAG